MNLSFNYIDGYLPNNIYNLQTIKEIDFKQNKLKGSLTYNIKQLFKLTILRLTNNSFSGQLPNEFKNLKELTQLYLGYNEFIGTIPEWIGDLSYLTELSLVSNHLTGSIPSKITSNLSSSSLLTFLSFGSNELTGTIPSWIGDLHLLSYLNLATNHLNGTIPASMSNLKLLISLLLRNNHLTGSFPTDWICTLTNMTLLLLDNNQLSGTLPSCISNLSSLTSLDIGQNKLYGTIPSSIGELSQMQILQLDNNQFTGILPSSFSSLISLTQLYISSNFLTGRIDKNIFDNLNQLQILEIQHNLFTGTLPLSIGKLSSLSRLFVQDNHLSGHLDDVFNGSFQRNLSNVQLSNNQFTGTLPEQLFLSSSLVSVSAVSNCFHGTIPHSICNNIQLQTLALDGLVCASSCQKKVLPGIASSYYNSRSITGGIPECLWSMPRLEVLHLSGNRITGTFPSDLSNLSRSLQDLCLSFNLIEGNIPRDIQERQWVNLDLSNNRISGTLLSSFNYTSNNRSSLSLNNNRLSGYVPSILKHALNLDILDGSYYDCSYDRHDLPRHDEGNHVYDCGSTTWNALYFVWLGLVVFSVISVVIIYRYKDVFVSFSMIIKNLKHWMSAINFLRGDVDNSSIDMMDDIVKNKMKSMLYLQRYMAIHEIILRFSLYSTIFIVTILLLIYTIVSTFYFTHTYEYAWTVALVYLSGRVAFGVSLVALISLLIFQIFIYLNTLKHKSNQITFYYNYSNNNNNNNNNNYNNNYNDNNGEKIQYYTFLPDCTKRNIMIWSMYILYITVNLVIVSGVNLAYVIVILTQSRILILFAEVLLSIFKIVWNNMISPVMVRWIITYLSINTIDQQSTLFFLQFIVSIFNNIIIPCLMVLIISPNCFYYVFYREPDVTSTFPMKVCTLISPSNVCLQYSIDFSTTSYSPPFNYSYQCSSAFITYYSPVFAFVCILSTFIVPLLQVLWIKLTTSNNIMLFNLSRLFYHPTQYHQSDNSVLLDIDEIYKMLVVELTLVALIMTFGAIFPPLAAAFMLTICMKIYYHQVILGRYIMSVIDVKMYSQLDILEDNLKVQPLMSTIQNCGWFLLFTACCFYTLFLFDILGDDVGFYRAYWVLIVIPCLPLCIYVCHRLYLRYYTTDASPNESKDGIQMSPALQFVSNPLATERISSHQNSTMMIVDLDAVDRDGDSI